MCLQIYRYSVIQQNFSSENYNLSSENMEKEQINSRTIGAINTLLEQDSALTKTALASSLNVKPAKFSEILNGRMMAGADIMALLCSEYNISASYILTGEGTMFNNGSKLPIAHHTTSHKEGIPLIPLSAMAGVLTGEQTVLEYECERYVVPAFNGADCLIPVKGNSMSPTYMSGDIVACQRVPMSGLFFQWNKPYVLDTSQGPLIKRIKPGSDKQHVLIVSDNEQYDPFELPYSEIHAVAMVIGIIRLE